MNYSLIRRMLVECLFPVIATFCVFLSAGLPSSSLADSISDNIVVNGNYRIGKEAILLYSSLEGKTVISDRDIDIAVKNLHRTSLFKDVNIKMEKGIVIINVEENPLIIDIIFQGNKKLKDEALSSLIISRKLSPLSESDVSKDVKAIYELYNASGYLKASVDVKISNIDNDNGRVKLVFSIDEGDISHIGGIVFLGNKAFTDNLLKKIISTKEQEWWRFFSSDDVYDPGRVEYDKELLRNHYLDYGYLDAQVTIAFAEISSIDSDFILTYKIDEGQQYNVLGHDFVSEFAEIPEERYEPILEGGKDGSPESYIKAMDHNTRELRKAFSDDGKPFFTVTYDISKDADKHEATILYQASGLKRVFIEKIEIFGNVRTLDRVIRRELSFSEGDPYDKFKIARGRANIQRLLFFNKVDIQVLPGRADDRVIISIEVEERSTGSLAVGAGYSSGSGGQFSVKLDDRNFLGTGREVNFNVSSADSSVRYLIGASFPRIYDRNIDAYTSVFNNKSAYGSNYFDYDTTGVSGSLGFSLADNIRMSLQVRIAEIDFYDIADNVSPLIRENEESYLFSDLTVSLSYDDRDNPINPTTGIKGMLSAGVRLSDNSSVNADMMLKKYTPIYKDIVIGSIEFSAGHIQSLGDREIMAPDRFSLGGGDRMRGFTSNGLGPKDTNTNQFLGGNSYVFSRSEATFPFSTVDDLGVRGGVFLDVGSVFGLGVTEYVSGSETRVIDDGFDLRASVGVAMYWGSPMGTMKFSWAHVLSKQDYDVEEAFQFSIGTSF